MISRDENAYAYHEDTEYEIVTMVDVPPASLRRDDELNGELVAKTKVGTKWVEIRDADSKLIQRVLRDETVTIRRRVETKESRDRDHRVDGNRMILRQLVSYDAGFKRAIEKLNEDLGRYFFADYSRLQDLMEEQAEYRVMRRFDQAVTYCSEQDEFEGDLVDVLDDFCDTLRSEVLAPYRNRGIGRSSNQLSNLQEDVDNEAKLNFIDNAKYWRREA